MMALYTVSRMMYYLAIVVIILHAIFILHKKVVLRK